MWSGDPGHVAINYNFLLPTLKSHLLCNFPYLGVLGIYSKDDQSQAYTWKNFEFISSFSHKEDHKVQDLRCFIKKTIEGVGKNASEVDIMLFFSPPHNNGYWIGAIIGKLFASSPYCNNK